MKLDRDLKLQLSSGKPGISLLGSCVIGHSRRCPRTEIEPGVCISQGVHLETGFLGCGNVGGGNWWHSREDTLDKVDLVFTQDALEAIAEKTLERKTGARGLRSLMEETLTDLMYNVPSDYTIEKVEITGETVRDGKPPRIEYNPDRKPVKIKLSGPQSKNGRRNSAS